MTPFLLRSSAAIALLIGLFAVPALAAEEPTNSITVVSIVDTIPETAQPGAQETVAGLLHDEREATQQDGGLLSYQIFQRTEGSNHYAIVETWDDMESYVIHSTSEHTVHFRDEVQPFLGAPIDIRIHRPFR